MTADPYLADLSGAVVHDETVPARSPWLHHIKAGETLRIVDLEGNQAVDFLLYSEADDAERYSAQDTVSAQGNLFLREGTVLRSNEGNPMMTIAGTSVAYHDTIGGACSCESNTLRYGHHTKAQHACVDGVEVLIMVCPECETILGIINHTHSGYFGRSQAMQDRTR